MDKKLRFKHLWMKWFALFCVLKYKPHTPEEFHFTLNDIMYAF